MQLVDHVDAHGATERPAAHGTQRNATPPTPGQWRLSSTVEYDTGMGEDLFVKAQKLTSG